jgi:hypothetical protein
VGVELTVVVVVFAGADVVVDDGDVIGGLPTGG